VRRDGKTDAAKLPWKSQNRKPITRKDRGVVDVFRAALKTSREFAVPFLNIA